MGCRRQGETRLAMYSPPNPTPAIARPTMKVVCRWERVRNGCEGERKATNRVLSRGTDDGANLEDGHTDDEHPFQAEVSVDLACDRLEGRASQKIGWRA